MNLKDIWNRQRFLEEKKLMMEQERAYREQQMLAQRGAQAYVDPLDYDSPEDYRAALKQQQMQYEMLQAQQNMARGQQLTAVQMQAQAMSAKQAQQAKYYQALGQADPARYQPMPVARTAAFFVGNIFRKLGPKLWRMEIASLARVAMKGEKFGRVTVGVSVALGEGAKEKDIDVRPAVNAVLAGLTHHVKSVERISVAIGTTTVEGPGLHIHLVEPQPMAQITPQNSPLQQAAARNQLGCSFESHVSGEIICTTHDRPATVCMQQQQRAAMAALNDPVVDPGQIDPDDLVWGRPGGLLRVKDFQLKD